MVFLIDLARLLGREDAFRHSANFRRQFERFRDIVSPAGWIPNMAMRIFDDALPAGPCVPARYAAKLYHDPTFLYAAQALLPAAGSPSGA